MVTSSHKGSVNPQRQSDYVTLFFFAIRSIKFTNWAMYTYENIIFNISIGPLKVNFHPVKECLSLRHHCNYVAFL